MLVFSIGPNVHKYPLSHWQRRSKASRLTSAG